MFEITAFAENAANTAGTAADAAGAAAGTVPGGMMTSTAMQFIIIAVMFGVLYFVMIRPQRKREKETQQMLSQLKVGDKIVTIGGIVGKITKIKDEFVYIESGSVGNPNEKSFLKFERSAIKTVEKKKQA